jgi:hypothetical protein
VARAPEVARFVADQDHVHGRRLVFVRAGVDPIDLDVNLGVDPGDLACGVADDRRRRAGEVVI